VLIRYGFNPGSVLSVASTTQSEIAALVAVNTTLGTFSGSDLVFAVSLSLTVTSVGLCIVDCVLPGACAGAVSAMFISTWWE
jgi:hypothetical protein